MPEKSSSEKSRSRKPKGSPEDDFLVVGLGASAGGIGALRDFFLKVPADSDMAYVVILHMSPEHESKLAEILQVNSPIPVTQVKQSEKIKPNHVYVIPPNRNLEMVDGHVTPTKMIGHEERRSPVDLFFRTLAETSEDRAVSVILSGTGANGSIGLKRIKEHGGVAFVQDPNEAEYKDMPRNAISTGMVDYVLPVSEIPAKIVSYKEHFGQTQIPEKQQPLKSDEQALLDVFTQLRVRTGHDFSNYKRATILRRIDRRMGLRELVDLPAYSRFLREQPDEVQALMKDLLISVTNFFRDPESIEALARNVLPRIFESKTEGEPVRIWVAGCATGEEAYSLAMLLIEYVTSDRGPVNLQMFATDLDQDAIQVAREGFYKDAEVADIPPGRLRRFFAREAEGYRVRRELRETILFAVHNVIKDPPFSHLDLISCRNLLIYLNRTAQSRVLEVAHFALASKGFLFLGASESIEGASHLFTVVDREHHIFRARSLPPRALKFPEITFTVPLQHAVDHEKTPQEVRAMERLSFADLHQRLLEQYAAPSVVVNEEYDIVHLSEHAGRYMKVAGGEPSNNLLKIIRPELRIELRTALYQAVHDRINVEARGLKVSTEKGVEVINVGIRPVLRDGDPNIGFILIVFEPVDQPADAPIRELADRSEPLATRLEDELLHLKAQLRATVEQYEIQQEELRASNEELQAMNEELRSAAEELETGKEELQSLNEELTTVNQELKIKIEELSQANNNFENLINSTNIGTIFLSRDFRVRRFTPSASQTFNLIAGDTGRPLLDITNKIAYDRMAEDMENVIQSLQTIERQVATADGKTYQMRLSPYRTLEQRIDGLVITLVDVTERARAEELVRRFGEEMEIKIKERTRELADANESLRLEVQDRKASEETRLALLQQLVTVQEDERRRLARDLHDQLGQQLTALRLKLESLKGDGTRQRSPAAIEEVEAIVNRLDQDVDFLAWYLRPVALDELGLETAVSDYIGQWSVHFNIPVNFQGNLGVDRLDSQVESNLYRITQEALNNCAKHSNCTAADVILERRADYIVLVIEDNGVGFDINNLTDPMRQFGLIGMRERVALLNGRFEIESASGKGTTILVRVPARARAGLWVSGRSDGKQSEQSSS